MEQEIQRSARVSDVGEFGLIDLLSRSLASNASAASHIVVGAGDDAAAWVPSPGVVTVITTDTMVENVHFRRQTISWRDLGWKAMAMNISDIAAMGAKPRYAVITLGVPPNEPIASVLELYDGLVAIASAYGVAILGGDTVSSPLVLVGATVLGETLPADDAVGDGLLRRSAAMVGDLIAVTGSLGGSAAGLRVLEGGSLPSGHHVGVVLDRHQRPKPRIVEAQFLLRSGVRAAADNSDGLLKQIELFCRASGVGAVIDTRLLPIDASARALFPLDSADLALTGGEEYELVITAPRSVFESLEASWRMTFDLPLTVVGSMTEEPNMLTVIGMDGVSRPASALGFDHFHTVL